MIIALLDLLVQLIGFACLAVLVFALYFLVSFLYLSLAVDLYLYLIVLVDLSPAAHCHFVDLDFFVHYLFYLGFVARRF